jgi:formylglycine-generating enzyme required for sulfatase activity
MNEPDQPVVRVSWSRAMAFCNWLGEHTGMNVTLPTEAQWEYACRAGTDTPFHYGDLDTDFAGYANLGDARLIEFAACTAQGGYTRAELIRNPSRYDDWVPKDDRYDDGGFVSHPVGKYAANAWGLHDMHGNVAEWTRTAFAAYPYDAHDGRNDTTGAQRRVVRGGSWYDRPFRCTSAYRLAYAPYQPVFNVGFRVVVLEDRDSDQIDVAQLSERN